MIRRRAVIGLAGLLVFAGGCSSGPGSDYGQLFHATRTAFAERFESEHITREQAAKIASASLGYRLGDANEKLLVLASPSGENLLWTSAAHVVIMTHDGRITRTLGLPYDVTAVTARGIEELPSPAQALTGPFTSTRLADFPDMRAYSTPLSCRAAVKSRQTIVILGTRIPTVRVDEACTAATLSWSFVDSFWVAAAGDQIWRSIQHTHPKGDAIGIELFRPPAE